MLIDNAAKTNVKQVTALVQELAGLVVNVNY